MDAQNGVFGLIQKGLVPKGADATAAFVVTPAPVLCGPVTLHKFEEQFKKIEIEIYQIENIQQLSFLNLINFISDLRKNNQRIIILHKSLLRRKTG
jgi:hypothetical protein